MSDLHEHWTSITGSGGIDTENSSGHMGLGSGTGPSTRSSFIQNTEWSYNSSHGTYMQPPGFQSSNEQMGTASNLGSQMNTEYDRQEALTEQVNRVDEDATFQQLVDAVAALQLSEAQEETFQRYCKRWKDEQHFPTDKQIEGLADLENLPAEGVRAWFQCSLPSPSKLCPSRPPSPHIAAADRNVHQPSDPALQEVKQFARERFRHPCCTTQAKKARSDLIYKCTSDNCNYTTDERDAWQRHEQLWQPQDFWHCILCRHGGKKFICVRKDKFLAHLSKVHKIVDENQRGHLRDASKMNFAAGFEAECKFFSKTGRCGYRFRSWEDRIKHYIQHFHSKISDGPWQLRYSRNRWFDDDEDSTGGSSSGGFSIGSGSGVTGSGSRPRAANWPSSAAQGSTRRSCAGSTPSSALAIAGCARGLAQRSSQSTRNEVVSAECSTSRGSRPCLLIDVDNLCLVDPPIKAKYLAFDHTMTGKHPEYASISIITSLDRGASSSTIQHLPLPLEKAVASARGMGYRYLWVAELCEPSCKRSSWKSIFEQAALTIVPMRSTVAHDQTMHLTCHYKNVQQVYSWAHQSTTFSHVQNLGYGAYGIVDEVRVQATQETFARKEVLRLRDRTKPRALEEIEIMQKLNHPHIAQFVAAYYEEGKRSLFILMTPVAQCNLREYLLEPSRWPDKRSDVPRWFISLASALEYMHRFSIRHKDIKPANILVSGHDVFMSDFGTSQHFPTEDSGSYGRAQMTPRYCAPEVAARTRRGRKADVFSLGCVFTEMASIELGLTLEEMHARIGLRSSRRTLQTGYHGCLAGLSEWLDHLKGIATTPWQRRLVSLCSQMLSFRPSKRPAASVIYTSLRAATREYGKLNDTGCFCCDQRKDTVMTRCSQQAAALRSLCYQQSLRSTRLDASPSPSLQVTRGIATSPETYASMKKMPPLWDRRRRFVSIMVQEKSACGRIELVHQSVRDYLQSQNGEYVRLERNHACNSAWHLAPLTAACSNATADTTLQELLRTVLRTALTLEWPSVSAWQSARRAATKPRDLAHLTSNLSSANRSSSYRERCNTLVQRREVLITNSSDVSCLPPHHCSSDRISYDALDHRDVALLMLSDIACARAYQSPWDDPKWAPTYYYETASSGFVCVSNSLITSWTGATWETPRLSTWEEPAYSAKLYYQPKLSEIDLPATMRPRHEMAAKFSSISLRRKRAVSRRQKPLKWAICLVRRSGEQNKVIEV